MVTAIKINNKCMVESKKLPKIEQVFDEENKQPIPRFKTIFFGEKNQPPSNVIIFNENTIENIDSANLHF